MNAPPTRPDDLDDHADLPVDAAEAEARRVFLADRDHPCPGCGYNLRDLTASHCPECRQELRIELRLADAGLRPYLIAIGGLVAATASGGLLFTLLCIGTVMYGDAPPPGWFLMGLVPTGLGAAGLYALARTKGRQAFQLAAHDRRMLIIGESWLPFIGLFLAFVVRLIVDG